MERQRNMRVEDAKRVDALIKFYIVLHSKGPTLCSSNSARSTRAHTLQSKSSDQVGGVLFSSLPWGRRRQSLHLRFPLCTMNTAVVLMFTNEY